MNVKLQAMLNAARYVEAEHGAPSLKQVLAACRPDTRVRLETGIAIEWLPLEQLIEFYEALVRIVADGDRDILRRCGAASAQKNLGGVGARMAAWVLKPEFVIRRIAGLWHQYNDAGEVRLIQMQPGVCQIEIRGVPQPHWCFCTSLLGWAEELARAVGWKGSRVKHAECRAEGNPRCVYDIRYRIRGAAQ